MVRTTPIIVDNGSKTIKAGFPGGGTPAVNIETLVGYPIPMQKMMMGTPSRDAWFGEEAFVKAEQLGLEIHYPIEHGIVTNWDDMERVWRHVFYNELSINPEEHLFVLTEQLLNPKANRERMTRIMFEKFCVPAMYVTLTTPFVLRTSGTATGLVVDSGDGVTHSVPVYEGYPLPHAITSVELGGRTVTEFLIKLLAERGYSLT